MITAEQMDEVTATFDTHAAARTAADAALPRRTRHNRPHPIESGYHSARAGGRRWIVVVGNAVLMTDGMMYDHQRGMVLR